MGHAHTGLTVNGADLQYGTILSRWLSVRFDPVGDSRSLDFAQHERGYTRPAERATRAAIG